MLRVGMQPVTLRVTAAKGRRASREAFPCRAWERSVVAAHHVDVRNPCFQELLTDNAEAQTFVKSGRLDLRAEHLLLQATLLGIKDHCLHQCIADLQAA